MSANTSCEQCDRLVPCRHGVIAGRELMCVQMPEHSLSIRQRIHKFLGEHGACNDKALALNLDLDLQQVQGALSYLISIGNVCKDGRGMPGHTVTYWASERKEYGIKGQQAALLAYLRQHGPATSREIRAGIATPRKVTTDLGRLANKGLVTIQAGTGRNAKYAATGSA